MKNRIRLFLLLFLLGNIPLIFAQRLNEDMAHFSDSSHKRGRGRDGGLPMESRVIYLKGKFSSYAMKEEVVTTVTMDFLTNNQK